MEIQTRIFEIADGHLDDFVAAWSAGVRPLRERMGFTNIGAWSVPETGQFVWILGYDGPEGFAAADAAYYDSEERHAIQPDPAQWIEAADQQWADRVA